jgi:hypothetical protein
MPEQLVRKNGSVHTCIQGIMPTIVDAFARFDRADQRGRVRFGLARHTACAYRRSGVSQNVMNHKVAQIRSS